MTSIYGNHFPLGDIHCEFPMAYHGRRIVLLAPFAFRDGDDDIVVPAGFLSDFNSTPRAVWWYFAPQEYPEAGVVHDWLYQHPDGRTRNQCDVIHRRILELTGCRKGKRVLAYLGIRSGGWVPWNKYRKAEHVEEAAS